MQATNVNYVILIKKKSIKNDNFFFTSWSIFIEKVSVLFIYLFSTILLMKKRAEINC